MATSPVRRLLDRLPASGSRRAELSVAAYRTAFDDGGSLGDGHGGPATPGDSGDIDTQPDAE